MVLPILISVSVAPGPYFFCGAGRRCRQARARPSTTASGQISCGILSSHFLRVHSALRRARGGLKSRRQQPHEAGRAGRHEVDDQHQDDAVDRAGRALRDAARRCSARTARTTPPNSVPAIEPTPPTTRPTNSDDREQEGEAVGRDELDGDRARAPRRPRYRARSPRR